MSKLWKLNDVLAAAACYGRGTLAGVALDFGIKPRNNLLVPALDCEKPWKPVPGVTLVEEYIAEAFYEEHWDDVKEIYRENNVAAGEEDDDPDEWDLEEFVWDRAEVGNSDRVCRIIDIHTTNSGVIRVASVLCEPERFKTEPSPVEITVIDRIGPKDGIGELRESWQRRYGHPPTWMLDMADILG